MRKAKTAFKKIKKISKNARFGAKSVFGICYTVGVDRQKYVKRRKTDAEGTKATDENKCTDL